MDNTPSKEEKSLLQLLDEAASVSKSDQPENTIQSIHQQIESEIFSRLQKIGLEKVDEQHETLVRYLVDIYKVMIEFRANNSLTAEQADLLEQTLANLQNYTIVHFRDEEQFMQDINYPDIEDHKSIHKEFVHKLIKIRSTISSGETGKVDELFFMVYRWLFDHINREDTQLASFYKG